MVCSICKSVASGRIVVVGWVGKLARSAFVCEMSLGASAINVSFCAVFAAHRFTASISSRACLYSSLTFALPASSKSVISPTCCCRACNSAMNSASVIGFGGVA